MKPHLFDAIVAMHNIRMELAPTIHGAIARFTFPEYNAHRSFGDRRVCFVEASWNNHGVDSEGHPYISGVARQVSKDRMIVAGFGLHAHITSDTNGDTGMKTDIEDHGEMICFKYTGGTGRSVTIRLTTSLISDEQAVVSMRRELPRSMNFDDIAWLAKSTWNR